MFKNSRPFLVLAVGFTLVGCSSVNITERRPASYGADDPVTVDSNGLVIVHDPNYVTPGLNVDGKEFGDDILKSAKSRLEEISKATPGTTSIEEPDYALARLTLQTLISNSIINYFGTLENINIEVKAYLTKIAALHDVIAQKEGASDPRASIYRDALSQLMFSQTPVVSSSINSTYTSLLNDMYTLNGSFIVPMTRKKDQVKRNGRNLSFRSTNSLFSVCQSYTCVKNLALDIQDWVNYVDDFNIGVSFENFDKHTIVRPSTVGTAPVVSRAVVDAANRLLDRALKDNKQYTLAGAIGAHVSQIVYKAPAGAILTMASGAIFVFEKTIRFVDKLFASPVMQLNLDLQPVDAYKPSSIISKLTSDSEESARTLPAVLYANTSETDQAKARAEAAAAVFGVRLPVPVSPDQSKVVDPNTGYIIPPAAELKPGCIGLESGQQVTGKRGSRGTLRKINADIHMAQIEYADKPGLYFWEVCEQFGK